MGSDALRYSDAVETVSPLRIGLVGVGDAGRHHARAIAALAASLDAGEPLCRLAALCARRPERAAAFAAAALAPPDAAVFPDLDAMLQARACDVAVLATPDALHAEQVRACAAAGVHVLCEKPLGLDGASARAAAAACRSAGVRLGVGYHLRHHAGHQVLRRALPRLGPLRHLDVRWTWPDPAVDGWRASGAQARSWALSALGTHALDLAAWLTGQPLTAVAASRWPESGIDRAADLLLQGPASSGGLLVHVFVSVELRSASRVSVIGPAGELEALGTLGAHGGGAVLFRPPRGEPEALPFIAIDPYEVQLRAFLRAVRDGHEPEVGGEAGARNVEWLDRLGPARPA